jgi:uncharacterized coiled-coil protein SlyX
MNIENNNLLKIIKDYFLIIVAFATIVGSFYVLQSNSKQHEERIQKLETKVSTTDDKIARTNEKLARIEEKLEIIYSMLVKNLSKFDK